MATKAQQDALMRAVQDFLEPVEELATKPDLDKARRMKIQATVVGERPTLMSKVKQFMQAGANRPYASHQDRFADTLKHLVLGVKRHDIDADQVRCLLDDTIPTMTDLIRDIPLDDEDAPPAIVERTTTEEPPPPPHPLSVPRRLPETKNASGASTSTELTPKPQEYKLPRLDVTYGQKLGSGAFGTVWQATDVLLDRPVAVKFLTSTDDFLDEHALIREARSLAKIAHPNLVTVYAAAYLRHPETGLVAPALMMELLVGEELHKWWARKHERAEVFAVADGFLAGVQAMHSAGLHHGDLHSQNVMVLADVSVKIIDWRYQDTFLQKSTAHRRDILEAEERRTIDLVVSMFEKHGFTHESLAIRQASDLKTLATAMETAQNIHATHQMVNKLQAREGQVESIHLSPLKRMLRLLDEPGLWIKMKGDAYLYCEPFPEFTIVDGETYMEPFSEAWTQAFPDKSARSFEVQLRYHSTLLDTIAFVACDGERYRVPMPKPETDAAGQRRYVISTSSAGWKLAQIYRQYYPLDTPHPLSGVELVP
jgi:tRNA A-37 threonylcarbamoyl transferase component Bud32